MFHTILTLSYAIPGIYLFVRIWQLFIAPEHRWWYVLVFAVLFMIYPSRYILEDQAGRVAEIAGKISDYLLPFFLYMFLLVVLTDIFLIINRLTGAISQERVQELLSGYRYFSLAIALAVLIVVAGIINFNTIRTTEYDITIPRKSSGLERLKVAFVSDFHLDEDVPARFVRKYVSRMNGISPDILLFGGDIVEGSGDDIPEYEAMLRSVRPAFGVYGAPGNHDRIRNPGNNFYSRAGIVLLRDSVTVIDNAFIIAGRNDNRYSRKNAAAMLQGIPDLPVIMIDHRPTDYENISKSGTDLVLSGHTHKGQLFPINLYLDRLYELTYGHIKKGDTHCIVSSGIRLWGPKVRTTGKSEIVVVNIDLTAVDNMAGK